ncbi:MAG: ABC transporter ATP-binding protein [Candidatus Hadarchaeota archaeon]
MRRSYVSILNVKNLSLEVENGRILNDISLEFEEGKAHALVGPNGAGKSSLAFAIMGLDGYRNIEGDIIFRGDSIKELGVYERAEKGITLAWQEPARYEGLTVGNFLRSSLGDKADRDVEELLKKVDMRPEEYLGRAMDSGLSGGERKKIELASILAMEPDLVMLDEPDSGIDVSSLERIREGIEHLQRRGATIVFITHSATVLDWADYAFLMCKGKVLDSGSAEKINRYFEDNCMPCEHKNEPEMNSFSGG